MTASLSLDHVSKSFGPYRALNDVSFSVDAGEIVGLLGPNGSGKTTTLRLIAGYLSADSGTVRVHGEDVSADSPETRRRIGYLPERPPLYDMLTVTHYLEFVAAARGLAGARQRAEIARVIEACQLGDVRNKPTGRLSKGFRQRVGLAQAALGDPAVMLLDEATNGLDPLQILEARKMVRQNAAGRAVVFCSHLMQEVSALCTRAIILYRGTVLGDIRIADVLAEPMSVLLQLRTTLAPEALRARLSAIEDVKSVTLTAADGDLLTLSCEPRDEPAAAGLPDRIARAACELGAIVSVSRATPDLERLFVDHIRAYDASRGHIRPEGTVSHA